MKVAVYTIALNEEQFVERWYESCKEADYLLIADTGSSDATVQRAGELGIQVVDIRVRPWRFDDARNASLAALPSDIDYCIALDMDEVLEPGWREELEKAFEAKATRVRYNYTWSWKDRENRIPGLTFGGDKIHARHGYRWKNPVHEVITPYGGTVETQYWTQLDLFHFPDDTKSRSQYLPLLKMSTEEAPYDDRSSFYYARELFFYHMYDASIEEFKRHLSLPTAVWAPERAASMRYLAKMDPENRVSWLEQAIAQSPGRREQLVELAQHYYDVSNWEKCYEYASAACAILQKPMDYLCEDFAWGATPWDLAAISSFRLGKNEEAVAFNNTAMELDPAEKRLKINGLYYSNALSEEQA